jgi:hypothetical protein
MVVRTESLRIPNRHDTGSTSPRSVGEVALIWDTISHYSPVLIAPLAINFIAPARPEKKSDLSVGFFFRRIWSKLPNWFRKAAGDQLRRGAGGSRGLLASSIWDQNSRLGPVLRCKPPSSRPGSGADGSRSLVLTDIKVLHCFHQNNDDSKCEAVHASPPIRPAQSALATLFAMRGNRWHRNQLGLYLSSGWFLRWR